MKRLLFFSLGPHFIATEIPVQEYYRWLSKEFEGEIFAVVSRKEFREYSLGNFRLVGLYLPSWIRERTMLRNLAYVLFVIIYGAGRHYFRNKFDVIVCKEPLVTGVLAVLLGKVCSIKKVVEINGNFESAFTVNSQNPTLLDRVKKRYAATVIPAVLTHADGVKLVYSSQLNGLTVSLPAEKVFVFPNFVPIGHFVPSDVDGRYILFCGFPWHLKGVDILIRAFQQIAGEFPHHRLKIVGYCPDKSEYEKLAEGNPQIELCDPVWYGDVMKLMAECSLFVLPSRTDSSPRVLREAMAARKPIIASNVDGIPYLIKDGYNGLLFESENVAELAGQIRRLLNDRSLANALAAHGYHYVHEHLSEQRYLQNFSDMIHQVTLRHAR
jgi:glycosyltransferase involved in cell wall biosynthesis